jgi:hypothetical protein
MDKQTAAEFEARARQAEADIDAERKERARVRAKRKVAAENTPTLPPLACLTVPELFAQPTTDYLVDELLPEGALAELVGDSESLKSFFAIHLGLAIASRRADFFGLPIIKHGPVIYIAAEGGGAFQYRVRAWATANRVDLHAVPFRTIPVPVNLRDETFQTVLRQLVADLQPVLIVVDTLHRCTPGAEENSSGDIGDVVRFAQQLQYDYRTAVLFLHHPPKSDPKGRGRGSGALYYAADTEILAAVRGDENADGTKVVDFTVRKQKDDLKVQLCVVNRIVDVVGEDGHALCFKSGRAIRTCVLAQATEEDQRQPDKAAQREQAILKYVAANPGQFVTTVIEKVGGNEKDTKATIDALLERGWLRAEQKGRGVVLFPGEWPFGNMDLGRSM